MAGWIKLHRKIISDPVFQNEKLLKVWLYCLLKASHKKHESMVGMQVVSLDPGEFVFGRKKAAIELNMKESTVWDRMKLLEKIGNIDIKSNNKFSVVNVVNWGKYQDREDEDQQQNQQQTDSKPTTNRQQTDTNKNVKNVKNVKNEKNDKKTTGAAAVNQNNEVHLFYQQNFPGTQAPYIAQDIDYWINDLSAELVIHALTKAVEAGKPYNYAKGIMRNWVDKGYKTLEEVNAEADSFKKQSTDKHAGIYNQEFKRTAEDEERLRRLNDIELPQEFYDNLI